MTLTITDLFCGAGGSSTGAIAAACAVLARIAWPNERPEYREEWAPKIAADPEVGRTTLRKARGNAHPDRNEGRTELWQQVEQAAKVLGGLT